MQNEKIKTLAEFLGVNENQIAPDDWKDGEFIVNDSGEEYLVLTEEEADREAGERIKDSLWAFRAGWILENCGLDTEESTVKSLEKLQAECCENCNGLILALVNGTCGLDEFIDSAVFADGRGHFISWYDGKEEELNGFYIYRIN